MSLKNTTEVLVLIRELTEDLETGKPVNSRLEGPAADRDRNILPELIILSPSAGVELLRKSDTQVLRSGNFDEGVESNQNSCPGTTPSSTLMDFIPRLNAKLFMKRASWNPRGRIPPPSRDFMSDTKHVPPNFLADDEAEPPLLANASASELARPRRERINAN
jgi:hypothetical protein